MYASIYYPGATRLIVAARGLTPERAAVLGFHCLTTTPVAAEA